MDDDDDLDDDPGEPIPFREVLRPPFSRACVMSACEHRQLRNER